MGCPHASDRETKIVIILLASFIYCNSLKLGNCSQEAHKNRTRTIQHSLANSTGATGNLTQPLELRPLADHKTEHSSEQPATTHQDLKVYARDWANEIVLHLASFLCELADDDQQPQLQPQPHRAKREVQDRELAESNTTDQLAARQHREPPKKERNLMVSRMKMVTPEASNLTWPAGNQRRHARRQTLVGSPLGVADSQLASSDNIELSTESPQQSDENNGEQESTPVDSASAEQHEPASKFAPGEETVLHPARSEAEIENELDALKSAIGRHRDRLVERRQLANLMANDAPSPTQIPPPEHNPFKSSSKNQQQSFADDPSYLPSHENEQMTTPRVGDPLALGQAARRDEQSASRAKLRHPNPALSQIALDLLSKHYRIDNPALIGEHQMNDNSRLVRTSAPYAASDGEHQLKQLLARQMGQDGQLDYARFKQPSSVYSMLNTRQDRAASHLKSLHSLASDVMPALGLDGNIEDLFYNKQFSTQRPARMQKSNADWQGGQTTTTRASGNSQLMSAPSLANSHFVAQLTKQPVQYTTQTRTNNDPLIDTYADSGAQYSPASGTSMPPAHSQILGLIRASPMMQAGLSSPMVAAQTPYSPRRLSQNKLPYQNPYIPLAYSATSLAPFTSASSRYTRLATPNQRSPPSPSAAHRIGRVADSATNYDDLSSQALPSTSSATTSASSDPMWSDTQNQQDDYQQSPQTIQITAVPNGVGLGGVSGFNSWGNGWGGWGGPWNGRQVLLVNRQPQVGNEWRQWILPVAAVLALPLVLGALFVPVFLKSVMFLIQILQMLGLLMPPAQLAGHLASNSIGNSPSG